MPLNKVGIKDIFHPVKVKDRARGEQHTVANFNMYVNLPHNFKGTHMSRFVEILHRHEREISVESFGEMLAEMTEHLAASAGHIEMTFPYFIMKKAPVSGVESLMNYQATIFGEHRNGKTEVWLKVVVPTTSLCPCSKEISDYGAHNQRSHITLTARLAEHMWLEELIDIAENQASCEVYGILKRPDEKYVTERAYDNPKFVEDHGARRRGGAEQGQSRARLCGRIGELRVDTQSFRLRDDRARQGSDRLGLGDAPLRALQPPYHAAQEDLIEAQLALGGDLLQQGRTHLHDRHCSGGDDRGRTLRAAHIAGLAETVAAVQVT